VAECELCYGVSQSTHCILNNSMVINTTYRRFVLITGLSIALSIGTLQTYGQQQAESRLDYASKEDSLRKLYVTFKKKNNVRRMLQRILTSLYTLDSTYLAHCPVWIIRDEDIKHRVYKMFRNNHLNPPRQSNVVVVTDPSKTEILLMWMGEVLLNTQQTRFTLSDTLKNAILTTPNSFKLSEGAVERFERTIPFDEPPKRVTLDMSFYESSLRFASGWGMQVNVGKDEIGYPFWSTGQSDMMVIFHQIKLGVSVPFGFGLRGIDALGPVSVRPRKLDGAPGIVMQFNHIFSDVNVEGRFSLGELTSVHALGDLVDPSNVYYINSLGQISLSHEIAFGNGAHVMTFTGGLGYHKIGYGLSDTVGNIKTYDRVAFFSPILKTAYVFNGNETFGISVQYYSNIVMADVWLELLKNFLYLEGKYSVPIIRAPHPWEQSYFFMISPRVRFAF
jgi:hypothetical protein